jgi:hypothetical protein
MDREIEIVREAVSALRGWIDELPAGSRWERPFEVAVREMTNCLNMSDRALEYDAYMERCRAWNARPVHERDRLTLECVGEAGGPLTVTEIAHALIDRVFPGVRDHYPAVGGSHIRSIVQRLHRAGELERIRVAPGEIKGKRNGTRWRYARKTVLSGPIADLERAFQEEGGAR